MPPVNRTRRSSVLAENGLVARLTDAVADDANAAATQLALAMSAAKLGEWTWNAKTDVLTGSTRAAEIVGLPADGGVTRSALRALVPPGHAEPVRAEIASALAARKEFAVVFPIQGRDRTVWVAVNGVGVFGANGEVTGMAGVVQDVTAQREGEANLRAREAQLRLISTDAPVILSHWSVDNRLLFASRAFAQRWQKEPEELVGKAIREILGEDAWLTVKSKVERVLAGHPVTMELEIPYVGIGPRFMRISY